MTRNNLTALIDAYGLLMAKRADVEGEKKKMEKALAELPEGSYEGKKYRLSISDSILSSDDDELKAKIKTVVEAYRATLDEDYVEAHTVKKPSRRHAAKARNGDVE